MNQFKNLLVWQKAIHLAELVYRETKDFPDEERFGLTVQIRRSSVSVASNIAEGAGRNSPKEFRNFLGHANGSCYELETQLIIAKSQQYLNESGFEVLVSLCNEVQKMLHSLRKKLDASNSPQDLRLNTQD